ncbi:hypothetical protein FQA39_LY12381 [Lamprigera yunnana]|nr:hypothetical protein FQA39_LY12381 [Lamprigera yunnana]
MDNVYSKRKSSVRPQFSGSSLNAWSTDFGTDSVHNTKFTSKEKVNNETIQNHFCFKSNNKQKKYLLLIVCILIIIIIILVAALSFRKQTVCDTETCVTLASQLMDNINMTASPCDDFYEFACGNFKNSKLTPDYVKNESKVAYINKVILKQMKEILEEASHQQLHEPYAFLKHFYLTCINDSLSVKEQILNVKNIFTNLGGWPTLVGKDWNETNFDWIPLLYNLRKVGIPHEHFYKLYVDVNPLDSSRYTLFLDVKPTSVDALTLSAPNKDYESILSDIFNATPNDIKRDSHLLRRFRNALFKIQNSNANDSYQTSLKQLHEEYPEIQCIPLIKDYNHLAGINISDEHPVFVKSRSAILKLRKLLVETSPRAKANYIFGEIATWMYQFIPKVRSKFHNINDTDCTIPSRNNLPLLLNALYVKKYLTPEVTQEMRRLWSSIQNQFENIFKGSDVFQISTRIYAIEKLNFMKMYVGYPDELLVAKNIENYYEGLKIDFKSYLNATMSINAYKFNKIYKQLQQPVNEHTWVEYSAIVTTARALYFPSHNSLYFPAGYIVNQAFSKEWPRYIKYALFGTIIGRTMTYGLDSDGSRFDKNGNLRNWWNDKDTSKFNMRANCFVQKYNKYMSDTSQISTNENLTQAESLADHTGLLLASTAYTSWTKVNKKELTLPKLNLTVNQIFWLSYAQNWCTNVQEDALKNSLNDTFAPNHFRVTGILKNFKQFSRDFNCPEKSPMNPAKKCSVW